MARIPRSPRLSSVLTAATAALSSIHSTSTPVTTSAINTSLTVAHPSIATTSVSSANSTLLSVTTSSVVPTSASSVADPSTSLAAAAPKPLSLVTTQRTTYAGVNIPGLDFSCNQDGYCSVNGVAVPETAAEQMQHFTSKDHLNIFRLTVSWQYLTNSVVGGVLDASNFATYDQLMQSCLATGAKCVVDIHNYVRPYSCKTPRIQWLWWFANIVWCRRAGMAGSLVRVALPTNSSLPCGHHSQRSTARIRTSYLEL